MVIADLQVRSQPSMAAPSQPFAFVEQAISVIEKSDLKYRVEPLGTVVQGTLEEVLELVPELSKAMRQAGAEKILTN